MEIVFDIETDSLDANIFWCLVAIDENNKVYTRTRKRISSRK